ncbi:MAG TPA: hypothetical protein VM097_12910 [Mycobacteriales bacterium]|nr:hypothetical protein [Mycobacteriales bacterium]
MEAPVCSAKGCRAAAGHAVVWNNPALHAPDREKVWHACDEHVAHLSQFVQRRGFLIRVDPLLAEPSEEAPEDPALPR